MEQRQRAHVCGVDVWGGKRAWAWPRAWAWGVQPGPQPPHWLGVQVLYHALWSDCPSGMLHELPHMQPWWSHRLPDLLSTSSVPGFWVNPPPSPPLMPLLWRWLQRRRWWECLDALRVGCAQILLGHNDLHTVGLTWKEVSVW